MRRRTKPATLPLGTVSEATLQAFDVIPELISAAQSVRMSRADRAKVCELAKEFAALPTEDVMWSRNGRPETDDAAETADEIWGELADILGGYVPDYCYFGAHEGDGACIGVWPISEIFDDTSQGSYDGDCWRLRENEHPEDEGVEIPADMAHALAVNDHGNATLYRRSGRRWVECWSVV